MKGLPWFRLYVDFLEDPKIVSLAFEDQRHFVCVLALKSSGMLDEPCKSDLLDRIVAQKIWVDHAAIKEVKRRLIEAGLIDQNWQPVAWERRQCRSDHDPTNAERQRRFKENKKKNPGNTSGNALANAEVTPTDIDIDLDTDTDTDTEKHGSSSVGVSISQTVRGSKRVCTRARKKSASIKSTIPDDFELSERVQAWAAQRGFEQLEDHLEIFRLKAASKGYQYVDWDSALMTAIREDWAGLRKNGNSYHAPTSKPTKQDRHLDSLHKLTGGLAGKSLDNTGEYDNVIDISAAAVRLG